MTIHEHDNIILTGTNMILLIILTSLLVTVQSELLCGANHTYGVDLSYPMHSKTRKVSNNYAWLPHNQDPSLPTPPEYMGMPVQCMGNKQGLYDALIQGCIDTYGDKGARCLATELDRTQMNKRQPKGMVNYTEHGYTKIRAPERVFKLIKEFWEKNKGNKIPEDWPAGNTYVNHWESPSFFVNVENATLHGGGSVLRQKIWNAARDTISEWTGQQLAECSLYGIRVYTEGAVLAPHVDRLPLVASAIINVDQDLDEPWPLEVIGHDGIAHNITMVPGDLVLYESHSILHGRPFPLKGRFMANVFVHFEPIGPVGEEVALDADLPKYIIRGSEEEENWRRGHPQGYKLHQSAGIATGASELHKAANIGDVEEVRRFLEGKAQLVNIRDENGWGPLHEAVRHGSVECIKLLLDYGADINMRTKGQEAGASGGTPLWWANQYHEEGDPVLKLLEKYGAKNIAPREILRGA